MNQDDEMFLKIIIQDEALALPRKTSKHLFRRNGSWCVVSQSSDEDLCFLGALAEVGGVSDTYEDDEMQFAASLFFTGRVLRFRVAAGMVTQRLQAHAMARINKWFV